MIDLRTWLRETFQRLSDADAYTPPTQPKPKPKPLNQGSQNPDLSDERRRPSVTLPRAPGESNLSYEARCAVPASTISIPDDRAAVAAFVRRAQAQLQPINAPDEHSTIEQFEKWGERQRQQPSTMPPPKSRFMWVDELRKWHAAPQQQPHCPAPRATGPVRDPWDS